MPQREVELILTRQLASYLGTAIFLVDQEGNLVYYNEAAEKIIGRQYVDASEMTLDECRQLLAVTDHGSPGPLTVALEEHRPAHGMLRLVGFDGKAREVAATAFPLEGQQGRQLGAAAIVWENPDL